MWMQRIQIVCREKRTTNCTLLEFTKCQTFQAEQSVKGSERPRPKRLSRRSRCIPGFRKGLAGWATQRSSHPAGQIQCTQGLPGSCTSHERITILSRIPQYLVTGSRPSNCWFPPADAMLNENLLHVCAR